MRSTSIALLLGLAAALAACGGDDDKPSSGLGGAEAKKVEDVARAVVVDADRSCDLLTANALETYTAIRGSRAKAQCEKQIARSNLPKTARVVVLSLRKNYASAGYATDQRVTGAMQLVKRDGDWLMDRVITLPPAPQ